MNQRQINQFLRFLFILIAGIMPFKENYAEKQEHPHFEHYSCFEYDLYWSFIKVGTAQLSYSKPELLEANKKKINMKFYIKSNSLIDSIYPIESLIESSFFVEDRQLRAEKYTKTSTEGGKKTYTNLYFDYELNQIKEESDGIKLPPLEIVEDVLDPLSITYAICNNDFEVNPIFNGNICDGGEIIPIQANFHEPESIDTMVGQFLTKAIYLESNKLRGVFKNNKKTNIKIHLSINDPAIPIKLESKVSLGTFYAIIKDYTFKGEKVKIPEIIIEKDNGYKGYIKR